MVLLRKTGFFDRIYTHVYGENKIQKKTNNLRELSGSKFHSGTSCNVILYNDVKMVFFIKVDLSGFGTELFNNLTTIQLPCALWRIYGLITYSN